MWKRKYRGGPGFIEWLEDKYSNLFWITGKPGTGKSTLMRYLSQSFEHEFKSKEDRFVIHSDGSQVKNGNLFFHKLSTKRSEKSFEGFLLAFLAQLCSVEQEFVKSISKTYEALKHDSSSGQNVWTYDGAIDALQRISGENCVRGLIVLYIDGFDECEGPLSQHLNFLLGIINAFGKSTYKIKACIARRDWSEIRTYFDRVQNWPYMNGLVRT